jgi:hypothetical protein
MRKAVCLKILNECGLCSAVDMRARHSMREPRALWRISLIRSRDRARTLLLEADGKGLPILLRQYDKVGGKMLAFNVDRKFSTVLDGLVVVDLRHTQLSLLERYMGGEGMAGFRRFHGI